MKKCLIFLDKDNLKSSIDLIEVANRIFLSEQIETYALGIQVESDNMTGFFDYSISVLGDEVIAEDTRSVTDIIEKLHSQYKFDSIIIPATHIGRMLAPRAAMRLKTGIVADVTDINYEHGKLELIRPAFSGKVMAGIVNTSDGPIMLSVRPNVFKYDSKKSKQTSNIDYTYKNHRNSTLKLLTTQEKNISYDIRESKVLISGGNGISKNFASIEALADVIGGQVSASRKIIDKKIAPRAIQVGQSGKTVSPELYIALGISGAIQHVEGLKGVAHIISVNTNVNAPICYISDIVVKGDARTFVDKLIERITKIN